MVSRRATFELRGFRVTGGLFGVLCGEHRPNRFGDIRLYIDGKCTVIGGGGAVSSSDAHGVTADQLTVSDLTIENAGQMGIYSHKKARVENVTVTGSGSSGMRIDGPAFVSSSSVSGSAENGITSGRTLRISDSTVIDNGLGPDCPYPFSCVDLRSRLRPKIVNTVCGTSGSGPNTGPWYVCAVNY